ncbi:hypothetical protein [Rhizobium rhizogenes]|jgi:hypothetical protein
MNGLTLFPHLEPANTNAPSQTASDFEIDAALEQQRSCMLHVTNYIEALYAQLLVSTNGCPSVIAVRDED